MAIFHIFAFLHKFKDAINVNKILSVSSLILIAALISVLIFAIRIFSKLTFSSFHLVRDSEERAQLTNVYISLIESGKLKDSDAIKTIVESLFARSDTGLLSGSGSPTYPGLLGLIERLKIK